MNIFQSSSYDTRLRSWYDLRKTLQAADIQTKCVEIDRFWQAVPLINHHLHPNDVANWPGPWDLISENTYCEIARGLGMIYTLLLLDVTNVDFCLAIDDNSEDVAIVLVDGAKYVLNYWPNTVLNNKSTDFTIKQKLDIEKIKNIIGDS
jgi:hypothetical protein